VRTEVQRQGIVWLDKDASYTSFVDGLAVRRTAGDSPLPVVGSAAASWRRCSTWRRTAAASTSSPHLIHMPGHNEESPRPGARHILRLGPGVTPFPTADILCPPFRMARLIAERAQCTPEPTGCGLLPR